MWRPVVPVAPIAGPLVTFERAAAELRLDEIDEADPHRVRVEGYVAAAEGHVRQVTGLMLATQGVLLKATCWSDLAVLPVAPIEAVASVTYLDVNGDTQTLDAAAYEKRLEGLEPSLWLKPNQALPTRLEGSLITVTATAGYGAEIDDMPAELCAAVLLLVRAMNDHGKFDPVTPTVDAILSNYRLFAA